MSKSKAREVWITKHEESIDPDKLTHIALFEKLEDREQMHFIEYSAYEALEHKLGSLLCRLTNNKYSYATYSLDDMEQMICQEFQEYAEEMEAQNEALRAELMRIQDTFLHILGADTQTEACSYCRTNPYEGCGHYKTLAEEALDRVDKFLASHKK